MWARLIAAIQDRFFDDFQHVGANEAYGDELDSLIVDKKLDDTGNFDASWLRVHLDLEDIEATAKERVSDVCQMAINMLNNDVWWKTCVSMA